MQHIGVSATPLPTNAIDSEHGSFAEWAVMVGALVKEVGRRG